MENFCYMLNGEEYLQENLNQSNFLSPEENERSFLNQSQVLVENNDRSLLNQSQIMLEEQEAETEENQNVEQQKFSEPIYRLNSIDTEVQIKTEIKELILGRVNEEISTNSLTDLNVDLQEQILNLRNKITNEENKKEELKKELADDEKRLKHSEEILLRANEIIGLLKKSLKKIMASLAESGINKLLERTNQQYEHWKLLNERYLTQLDRERQCLANEEKNGVELEITLKKELTHKEEILQQLKTREEELKSSVAIFDDETEKNMKKKEKLEGSLNLNSAKKDMIEKELKEQNDNFEKLSAANDEQILKLNELKNRKDQFNQHFAKLSDELHQAETNASMSRDEISEKEANLKTLQGTLSLKREEQQEFLAKLEQEFSDICRQVDEKLQEIVSSRSKVDQLLHEMNTLNSSYIQTTEKELELVNKNLQLENKISHLNLELLKKQTEIDVETTKVEEAKIRYDSIVAKLQSLEDDITEQRKSISNELIQVKLKLDTAQTEYVKFSSELERKKSYLLENAKLLEEKSENLHRELTEREKSVGLAREENQSIELLAQNKTKNMEELQLKLNDLKNTKHNAPLKHKNSPKSAHNESTIKKVKFNDVLSIKSPTSSDMSNLPGENVSQLNNSFLAQLLNNSMTWSQETLEQEQ